ncbi:MAG: alkyl hydroperoxide reductase/Thiol specific antioxidant/Mal allergen [Crocinitomicaceae bacterium]|nr:alkyl hydroperoxide reductase/Thiol specific antioxidant/Mal allergen [Crocinitomicaceae bacterium]
MKTLAFSCALFALLAFTFKKDKEFNIGDKAPLTEYKMKSTEGKELSLNSAKEKNGLLVIFSCNTCPFVVGSDNFPGWEKQYNDLHKIARDAGIQVILVNSNEAKRDGDDSFENMQKHAKDLGYTMPYVVDKDSELANAFGAKTTPHVYLLDAGLNLVYKGSIDNSWDNNRKETIPYLATAIKEVKDAKTITTNTTDPRGCSIKRTK